MKFFTVYSAGFDELLKLLRLSIKYFGDGFEFNPIFSPLPTGWIGSQEWERNIDFKLDRIIETIEINLDKIIVWSDVDTVFTGYGAYKIISEKIKGMDLACMVNDAYDNNPRLNGGFVVIRCSEKTLNFYKAVKEFPKEFYYDQTAIRELIPPHQIKVSFLPDSFWACHRRNELAQSGGRHWPEHIIFYHATSYVDPGGKADRIKMALMGDFGPLS